MATSAARARSARQRAKRAVLVDYAEAEGLPCHSLPANFAKQTEWQVPQPEGGGAFDIGVVASFGHFVVSAALAPARAFGGTVFQHA